MTKEIIISGFGGQGVLSIGKMIAEAANLEGLEVSWLPSYGPEMRGGTANCAVVVSDSKIGSPLTEHPDVLIALNQPSVNKYVPMVRQGGLVIINQGEDAPLDIKRDDITLYTLDSSMIATGLGNIIVANVVMFGAFAKLAGVISFDTAKQVLAEMFQGPKAKLLEMNYQALEKGRDSVHAPRKA